MPTGVGLKAHGRAGSGCPGGRRLAHVAFLRQTYGENRELLLKADEGAVH